MKKIKRSYGWHKDHIDFRDFKFLPVHIPENLPSMIDLANPIVPILNQGQLGSCTANAIASCHYFEQIKQDAKEKFTPSRLFIYYNEREMEGTVKQDSGAQIRDGMKSVATLGVCPETEWKYDVTKFTKKPLKSCYTHAAKHQVMLYASVIQSLDDMRSCLASGFPFVFGFSVYDSFESDIVARTGIVPMPARNESLLGGHAVLAVGYNDQRKMFKVQNSWGSGWGDKGFFYLPYSFISNPSLASDMWKITLIES